MLHVEIYYKVRQDIRIYVPSGRPNGWTEWAEFFFWTLMSGPKET